VGGVQDYNVTIRGIAPLMHNRYPMEVATMTKKKQRGTVFNPEEEVKKTYYTNSKGEIIQPAEHIEGALIQAGSAKTVPGLGKKTYKDLMKTNVAVLPTEIPFPNGKDYKTDIRLAVIPATRGRVPVARARWDEWEFNFTIRVFDNDLTDGEALKDILEIAGKTKGIGTYRPKYGRFEVVRFEPVKTGKVK
jgi:hypothetical protein